MIAVGRLNIDLSKNHNSYKDETRNRGYYNTAKFSGNIIKGK